MRITERHTSSSSPTRIQRTLSLSVSLVLSALSARREIHSTPVGSHSLSTRPGERVREMKRRRISSSPRHSQIHAFLPSLREMDGMGMSEKRFGLRITSKFNEMQRKRRSLNSASRLRSLRFTVFVSKFDKPRSSWTS